MEKNRREQNENIDPLKLLAGIAAAVCGVILLVNYSKPEPVIVPEKEVMEVPVPQPLYEVPEVEKSSVESRVSRVESRENVESREPRVESREKEEPKKVVKKSPPPVKEIKISRYYEEGYDTGYDDGEDDAVMRNGFGGQFDDENDYKGWKKSEYEQGYSEGYEAGYEDNL